MTKDNSQKPNVYHVLLANDLYIKVNVVLVGDSNNLDTINYSVFNLMKLCMLFCCPPIFLKIAVFQKFFRRNTESNSWCADQG